MDKIEKFVDKWIEQRRFAKDVLVTDGDVYISNALAIKLLKDFSKTEWHTPDEKPNKGDALRWAVWKNGTLSELCYHRNLNVWAFLSGDVCMDMNFLHTSAKNLPQPTEEEWKLLDK